MMFVNKLDVAGQEKRINGLLERMREDGFVHEADSIGNLLVYFDPDDYGTLFHIIYTVRTFLIKIPKRYTPRAQFTSPGSDTVPLHIEAAWSNYALGDIVPRANFSIKFMRRRHIGYSGSVEFNDDKYVIEYTESNSLQDGVNAIGRIFSRWPRSPRVDIAVEEKTRLGFIMDRYGASMGTLDNTLEDAMQVVFDGSRSLAGMDVDINQIIIPKTNIPELDNFAEKFISNYEKRIDKYAAKHRLQLANELFPLARTVFQKFSNRPAFWVHSAFWDCAYKTDADVCWRCGQLGNTVPSENETFHKLCSGCVDALVYGNGAK